MSPICDNGGNDHYNINIGAHLHDFSHNFFLFRNRTESARLRDEHDQRLEGLHQEVKAKVGDHAHKTPCG